MSWPWSQLGLPGPADLSEVRHAYAEKLKTTHPEDDPEGFQRLHSAYQLASRMARQRKQGERPVSQPGEGPGPALERPERTEQQEFDFDGLLQEEERPRRPREEDFNFEELLREEGERPRLSREEEQEERDFDFERLFAEGEAERAEARRRRGEERRKAQERELRERIQRERALVDELDRERRAHFDQEQFRWQNTETILHTMEMLYHARADREAWEKFFQSDLFQQTKGNLDLIFGLEDFVSSKDLSREARVALFLAYGFEKGPSRPELRPLYQMLLESWQVARARKKKERLLNVLAIPITLVLIYVAAVILISPLLIGFILLGLLAVHGLNKGWFRRRPKTLGRGQRSGLYAFCALAACAVASVLLLPRALGTLRDRMPGSDPRARVCRYLEEDYGVEVRSLYNKDSPDERFGNVFALEDQTTRMFLAGPDGDRDKKAGKLGYTTNYPDMMVLWAMEDFAREHGLGEVDLVNRNRGLGSWDTSGTYLIVLPFYGAGDVISALGERLEELAEENWYQVRTPEFKLVLCGDQMEEGRLILQEYESAGGPFEAEETRRLYEESFGYAYCGQLLKELELDRDFVRGGGDRYTLASGGMEEMRGEECLKLYGLREDGTAALEYYVNLNATRIYCVPGGFWEEGGSREQLDFYRMFHREGTEGMVILYYPWIRVN